MIFGQIGQFNKTMNLDSRIFVAGQTGFIGKTIYKRLNIEGYNNIINAPHVTLDLTNQRKTLKFFELERPEYVIFAAGNSGGINANEKFGADFILNNTLMISNVISASHNTGVKKLLYIASTCVYPKLASIPILEEDLLNGKFEPTNEFYALSKCMGIKLCQAFQKQYNKNFISCIPCNIYGPGDTFSKSLSHVIPALIVKMIDSTKSNKIVRCRGSGNSTREFLYVDDLAEAIILIMNKYSDPSPINIGSGKVYSISQIVDKLKQLINPKLFIEWTPSQTDGATNRMLNCNKIKNLGWESKISIDYGLKSTYHWYLNHININDENLH
jgi:GDP-L-fucose synthase